MKNHVHLNQPRNLKWYNYIFIFLIVIFLSSCGSVITQSTVKLSADVGSRLTEMEQLHQLAIQRYFDMERQKIENFLTDTWEPLFLENFLGTSQVLEKLQNVSKIDQISRNQLEVVFASYLTDSSEAKTATDDLVKKLSVSRKVEENIVRDIVSSYVEDNKIDAAVIHITSLLGTDEPARIIFDFTEAAHLEMNARRQSLLAPLIQLQSETVAELSAAYAELIRGQSTITGRLEAAAKVSQEQDKLFETFGIKLTTKEIQLKLSNLTTKLDGALKIVSRLTEGNNGVNTNLPEIILNALEDELKEITTSVKSDSSN